MTQPDGLSPRQQQVLERLRKGQTTTQIADELGLSVGYVRRLRSDLLCLTGSTRPDPTRPQEMLWELNLPEQSHSTLKRLSPRHREILSYALQGLTSELIAEEMAVTRKYVVRLRCNILTYTCIPSGTALLWAMNQARIHPDTLPDHDQLTTGETSDPEYDRHRKCPVLLRGKYRFRVPAPDQARDALERLSPLTRRQQEVIALYTEGLTASEIASRLDISFQRVVDIRQDAMQRLNAKTVMELIR